MTIAAIYARKSTEQSVPDETKSVTRQVDNAKAFALKMGWTVPTEHIYIDDGISGAEFEKRPAFMSMMATLPRPPFRRLMCPSRSPSGVRHPRRATRSNNSPNPELRSGVCAWSSPHSAQRHGQGASQRPRIRRRDSP